MDADHSRNQLRESINQRRECARNTKKTHFAFGSTESDFQTISMEQFQDVIPSDASVPAAGIREDIPPFKFNHFGASVNIDATAGKCPPSVMGQDYIPLEDRKWVSSKIGTRDELD